MPDFPKLAIIPIRQLLCHERADHQRVHQAIEDMHASSFLRNPLIVARTHSSDRYWLLDGTNHLVGLQEIGIPHAVVQIVDQEDPGVGLSSWSHMIGTMNPEHFPARINAVAEIRLRHSGSSENQSIASTRRDLLVLQTHLGDKYFIEIATQSLEERCQILDQITQIYNHQHFLGQTTLDQIDLLLEKIQICEL